MIDGVDRLHGEGGFEIIELLLELLNPETSCRFTDRYLGLPVDLSHAILLLCANSIDFVPDALEEHLDVIEVPGYSEEEKLGSRAASRCRDSSRTVLARDHRVCGPASARWCATTHSRPRSRPAAARDLCRMVRARGKPRGAVGQSRERYLDTACMRMLDKKTRSASPVVRGPQRVAIPVVRP